MFIEKSNVIKTHIIKLEKDSDLLDSLTLYAEENNIQAAEINFIGAVQSAKVLYFNQEKKKYDEHIMDQPYEVLSGIGNISLLDDKPFVHVHIVLADSTGKAYGGHLDKGTKVWLIEAFIHEVDSKNLVRKFDENICLSVWS
ncbi:MAG: DNA-binding protein [Actinomycetota bacterium]|nr:DNA-binding protein [Actinomycetota bacterium]MDA3013378.1 DNA-binding protein [Actinomycetota bacterium]